MKNISKIANEIITAGKNAEARINWLSDGRIASISFDNDLIVYNKSDAKDLERACNLATKGGGTVGIGKYTIESKFTDSFIEKKSKVIFSRFNVNQALNLFQA